VQAQSHVPHEVIVIDDASEDESLEVLARHFPDVRALPSSAAGVPRGFAGAVNAGIRASTGELVALLNNDTECEPQWLAEMVRVLLEHPRAASCACRMLQKDRMHVNAVCLMLTAGGAARTVGDGDPDGPPYEDACGVFGPSGGAALWRRDVFERIGLFDEDYFAYCEDADLAFRARAAGYDSVYAPRARIVHLEGRCPSLARGDKVMLRIRNGVWFAFSNLPGAVLRRRFPRIFWETWGRYLFKYGPRPWKVEGRSFWRATGRLLCGAGLLFGKRRERLERSVADTESLAGWLGWNPFSPG
jgi:GT2 family glycosyltransferase